MKRKINYNPLCEAVIHNDLEGLINLIDSGADIDGVDYNHITALCYAVERGNISMAKLLLEKGANIEFRDPWGNTPLSTAVFHEGDSENSLEMIHLLLSYGADVNAENNYGVSPKSLANTIAGFPEMKAFKD